LASLALAGAFLILSAQVGRGALATVGTGANVTLSVAVNGSDPLTYQWKKNGAAISGATGNSYSIIFAQTSDAGSYTVTASNSFGSTSSDTGQLTVLSSPANDQFANATLIVGPWAVRRGANIGATKEASEPQHAGNAGGHSIWWRWVAPAAGYYTVNTIGSSLDTLLGVYTGANVFALTTVASNDDANGNVTTSSVSFQATAGLTYFIAVDGKNGATGAIVLQLTNQSDFLPPYPVSTLAGTAGSTGSTNATGAAARFSSPASVAVDSAGNVYVADKANHVIRMITTAGVVTTLAGSPGVSGTTDGTGAAARFSSPSGVAVDIAGTVYVADSGNHTIRKIASGGVVSTMAGTAGSLGTADGNGSTARFNNPTGVAVDSAGNVYVADYGNSAIRKVTPWNAVTTLAGIAGVTGFTDGTGSNARFYNPTGVAVDGAGNVYVADTGYSIIRKVSPTGVVTTIAGSHGLTGTADGLGSAARFNNPAGVGVDAAGNVYVADYGNHTIRFINAYGLVTTVAGSAGSLGSTNGTGSSARFFNPRGVAIADATGNLVVADFGNQTVRKTAIVNAAPVFTTQPVASQTALAGSSITLNGATGTGWPAVTFQWRKNGVVITGATNSTYTLNNLSLADASTYTLTATNSAGSVTSGIVTLTVGGAPTINVTGQPAGEKVALGSPASFTVTPTSSIPVTYQWRHNGVNIPGATNATYSIASVGVADLGTYDVVITSAGGSVISNPVTLELPGSADFSGDGNVDLIWQNMITGERLIWEMDGPVYLGSVSLGFITTDWSIVGTGDFNGDGQTDLLWQNTVTGECLVWLMNGTSFVSSVSLGFQPRQMRIAGAGDFNGDGASDILWQNTLTGEVSVWLMNGTTLLSNVSLGFPSLQVQVAGAGDFNGDGKPDIIFTNTITGEVSVWLMNNTTFVSNLSLGFVAPHLLVSGTGDFNGDGQTDIFFTDTFTGDRSYWQMNGTTVTATVPITNIPLQWVLNRPIVRRAVADFNGDGNSDLVWQNTSTGERVIWLMTGTDYQGGYYFGVVPTVWTIAALGDMNGDGQSDILWQNSSTGERVVWLMNGTTFVSGASLGVITTDWSFAGSGDFNGDGHTDILWQNTVTGERVVWLMNGTTYLSGVSLGVVPLTQQIVGTGDFNGDGQPDILWQNATTHEITVWLMNGTTVTSTVSLGFATAQQQVVGTGDFGGDGQTDIVLQDTVTGIRSIWLMNHTTFVSNVTFTVIPLQWTIRN
jgi:hypothetical protein